MKREAPAGARTIGRAPWLALLAWGAVAFLLMPLALVALFSFSASRLPTTWGGFTLRWYETAMKDRPLWESIRNSLVVASVATLVATPLGTLAALALGRRAFRGRALLGQLLHVPVLLPEIVLGIALLSTFVAAGLPLGLGSVIAAHITVAFPFVALIVLGRVKGLDPDLERAALDLGASPLRAFRDAVLPALAPGVVAGALFAFTISLDDFVVTFFTAGPGASTFPLLVWGLMRHGVTPSINAAATLVILATALLLAAMGVLSRPGRVPPRLKAGIAAGAAAVLLALVVPAPGGSAPEVRLLNFSSYLDPALLGEFEKETGIRVRQDYTNSNEETLAKLKLGGGSYDLVIATGYLVELLARENLLQPLPLAALPALDGLDPRFRHPFWDPEGRWAIPYTFGMTGIAWNSDVVRGPVDSWWALWDPAYKGRILMTDEGRECFVVAFSLLGAPLDQAHRGRLPEALEILLRQKALLKKYESNLTTDLLVRGEVVLAQTWSGYAWRAALERPAIRFSLPKEGALLFVDSLCIPRGSAHPLEAARFADFVLRPKNAARNMQATGYSMPYPAAIRLLPAEMRESTAFLPPIGEIADNPMSRDLGSFAWELDRAWTELKSR